MKENTMDDVAITTHSERPYFPLRLTAGDPASGVQGGDGLVLHSDGQITVNWERLEIFARCTPVTLENCNSPYFQLGCLVRALLAMRDGRITVVEDGDG